MLEGREEERVYDLTHEVEQRQGSRPFVAAGLDGLGPVEAARWRRLLEQTSRPCGCKSGAALAITALAAWPAWLLVSGPRTSLAVGLGAVAYPVVVIAAGMVGKVAGIIAGRWRHRRLRRQLAHRIASLPPTVEA